MMHLCREVVWGRRPQRARFVEGESELRDDVLSEGEYQIHAAMQWDMPKLTVAVFRWTLGKECVISHQGEIRTAPAGMGNPESRMTWSPAMHSPPPAESPEKTMLDGETGVCNAPGGGCMRYRSIRRLDHSN